MMMTISQLFEEINLHDSYLDSIFIGNKGEMILFINVDEVWNKDLDPGICGISFTCVYEIRNYNISCLDAIGSVEFTEIKDYDRNSYINHFYPDSDSQVYMIDINSIYNGRMSFICSDSVRFIKENELEE